MGDEKYYTVQVKGEAYRFRPVSSEAFERIAFVNNMSVEQTKVLKAISKALAEASVGDSWDRLTDRWLNGEITTAQSTIKVLETLIKRQNADEKKAAPAAGDDE